MLNKVVLILGGNIEPRNQYLTDAIREIELHIGEIVDRSSVYETTAWGFESEDSFLNLVISVDTNKDAKESLGLALEIESKLGRKRDNNSGYNSRTMDIDILYFNNDVIAEDDLIIPHPRLQLRKFVLLPLMDIAADYIHPVYGVSNRRLLEVCKDDTKVEEVLIK